MLFNGYLYLQPAYAIKVSKPGIAATKLKRIKATTTDLDA